MFRKVFKKGAEAESEAEETKWWPKTDLPEFETLSASDQRRWNNLAVSMDRFHAHFRDGFKRIYEHADKPEKLRMDLDDFLLEAMSLSRMLHMHHNIEETYIFPFLAKRMPEFQGDLPAQHKEIHDGLDLYDVFLSVARETPSEYSPEKLREIMDGFRDVLMRHLDEEVESLQGDNLRKYWTIEEIRQLPI